MKTDLFPPLCDVAIGETVVLHTTLQWVSDLQFDNVDFVLDSQQVVDSFHTGVDDNSKFDCIINATLFQDSFHNSKRQANRVVNELVRIASSQTIPISMMMYRHIFDIYFFLKEYI
jgi:hypothetical protein